MAATCPSISRPGRANTARSVMIMSTALRPVGGSVHAVQNFDPPGVGARDPACAQGGRGVGDDTVQQRGPVSYEDGPRIYARCLPLEQMSCIMS